MRPDDVLAHGAGTYREKNDDYGDSWRLVGQFMHELAGGKPVTLETEADFIAFGLYTRRLDKLARAFNGRFLADDMNFEGVQDSHEDEMVYAAMHASLMDDERPQGKADHPTVVPNDAD